jgi:allantoinase
MMSVGLHSRVIGHPARAAGLERFLDHVASHPDVWVCRRQEIADHWRSVHPPSDQA